MMKPGPGQKKSWVLIKSTTPSTSISSETSAPNSRWDANPTLRKTKRLRPIIKNLPAELEHIKNGKFQESDCSSIRLYVMDESRFGLLSIQRRCLTARGTKPLVPYQHRFQNFYLFGAYNPSSGDHFTLELPRCNSACFQLWMDEFSAHRSEEFKVVVLDNGAFHKSK